MPVMPANMRKIAGKNSTQCATFNPVSHMPKKIIIPINKNVILNALLSIIYFFISFPLSCINYCCVIILCMYPAGEHKITLTLR